MLIFSVINISVGFHDKIFLNKMENPEFRRYQNVGKRQVKVVATQKILYLVSQLGLWLSKEKASMHASKPNNGTSTLQQIK